MVRKVSIGMPGFPPVCLIGGAGYRLGQHLAGHDRASAPSPT